MIGSAREIHDLCSKVKDSAKAEPENLGHRVSTAILYVMKGKVDKKIPVCLKLPVFVPLIKNEFCFCLILHKLFTRIFTCDRCNNGQLFWSIV